MDFEFNDQQFSFREAFRSFFDGAGAARGNVRGLDAASWGALADLGLFAMLVPEEYGGLGLEYIDTALVIEELGRSLTDPLACETLMAADLIARQGNAAQKAALLPKIAAGKLRVTSAVLELDGGFELDGIHAQLADTGTGLSCEGAKILVAAATLADLLLVAVRGGPVGDLGLVLIEPRSTGVELREQTTLDVTCSLFEVTLRDVQIAPEDRLGTGTPAVNAVGRLLELASTSAALQMMGIAGKVLDLSTLHATDRIQFGKPIATFQAIKHKCADMAVAIESGRSAAYYAAWALTAMPSQCSKPVSIAKAFAGDTVSRVCNEGIQIHGGMGFTWELGLHLYLRRAKLLEHLAGDAAYHRERVMCETLAELELT